MSSTNQWPTDADGDVFRRLQAQGFDFTKEYVVDFTLDFETWPPPTDAVRVIEREFPGAQLFDPEDGASGYVRFQVKGLLTYELVVTVQARASVLVEHWQGVCESWGLLH